MEKEIIYLFEARDLSMNVFLSVGVMVVIGRQWVAIGRHTVVILANPQSGNRITIEFSIPLQINAKPSA